MKKIGLIVGWIVFCIACNSNRNADTRNSSAVDSAGSKVAPTPGLGSDPTRNDASKPTSTGRPGIADSTTGNPGPTPGLGNDPTRNDASRHPLTDGGTPPSKQDSGLREN